MEDETQIIETVDAEGNVIKFELYDIVEVDEQEYALLIPVENDDDELVLMRLTQEGEEYIFESIEDDDEYDKVAQYVENMDEEDEEE